MPAPTMNEAFRDAMIRRQVGLVRMAPTVQAQINKLLSASERDLKDRIKGRMGRGLNPARLRALLASIKEIRAEAWTGATQEWMDQLTALAKAEPAFMDRKLNALSPAQLELTLPSDQRLAALVTSTPFEGRVLGDWASRQEAADLARIEQGIRIGMTQGQTVDEIAGRLFGETQMGTDGLTQITRNNAFALTRTSINAITAAARAEFVDDNSDVFSKELFVATLDSRTTILCGSLDHKVFDVGDGPIPPLHWNCRSLRVPMTDSDYIASRPARNFTQQSLLRDFADDEDIDVVTDREDLPRGYKGKFDDFAAQRMRELTGQVPADMSYSDWLSNQSAALQDDILGRARGKMFRDGDLTLDQFVAPTGRLFTLDQLESLD